MKKIWILVFIVLSLLTIGYFLYDKYLPLEIDTIDMENIQKLRNDPTETETDIPTPPQEEETPIIETTTFDEKPAKTDAKYFEKVVKVKGEYLYLASPITVQNETPPTLILYSHGSNTTVSKDFTDPFMKDMQMYGEYFTKRGFVFAASSMHGANWGSDSAIADMKNSVNWISTNYLTAKKIDLFGFSMGGLPTFNFLFKYPSTVNSVALLAPTSRDYTKAQYTSIRKIPIHIWHGDKDVNVPLYLSQSVYSTYKSYGFKKLELDILSGKSHFDIDTELRKEVLNFFQENAQ